MQDVSEPATNNETGITSFEESSNVVTTALPGFLNLDKISNPFPDQTPHMLLNRTYLIDTFDWIPGLATKNYRFPQQLLTNPVIKSALSPFTYFRAGYKIQIKLNSTPYHQGALMVSSSPCSTNHLLSLLNNSGFNPIVLSASVQDSCTIEQPYINPTPWMSTTPSSPESYAIGATTIQELNTLISTQTGVPVLVPVSVYASLTNVQTAGFRQPVAAPFQAQSARNWRKTVSLQDDSTWPTSKSNEASTKQEKGIATKSTGKIIGGISEVVKLIPVVGDIWKPIAGFIKTFAGNLDKPNNTSAINYFKNDSLQYQNLVTGLSNCETFTMYPNVSVCPSNFGLDCSDMSVSALAAIPMLHSQFFFQHAADKKSISVHVMAPYISDYPMQSDPDFLSFTAAAFQYWRGSIKYLFHFVSSGFYSTRFRITYANETPTIVNGDLPQLIVDVKGDTITEFTIPYLWPTFWRTTGLPRVDFPKIYIEMLSDISGPSLPSEPLIYLNVWRAAGEDIEFSLLKNATFVPGDVLPATIISSDLTSSKLAFQAQTSPFTRFKKSFAPVIEGSAYSLEMGNCMPEVGLSIKDCTRRNSSLDPTTWLSLSDLSYVGSPSVDPFLLFDREPFPYFSHVFLFWKGSRRVFDNQVTTFGLVAPSTNTHLTSGSALRVDAPYNYENRNGYEIQYSCEVPYVPVKHSGPIPFPVIAPQSPVGLTVHGGSQPESVDWAAGDDFMLLSLTPPLIQVRSVLPTSSKKTALDKPSNVIAPNEIRSKFGLALGSSRSPLT
jgi:hypothetical protein